MIITKVILRIQIYCNRLKFLINEVKFGKDLNIQGFIKLKTHKTSKVKIGNNFSCLSGGMYNTLGRNIKVSIRVDKGAILIIGENVGMSNVSIWSKGKIEIGDNVKLGADVMVFDSDMHSLDYKKRRDHNTDTGDTKIKSIKIVDDVFIGTRSIITKGVCIGDRSIIASGSIVTKPVPSDEIWGGNPAKFLKKINDE